MKSLQLIALGIGAIASVVVAVYLAIDLFDVPGGARAFFTLIVWLAIPFVLTVFAATAPRGAYPVLVVLVGIVLVMSVASIPAARSVAEFENNNGPIRLMVLMAILVPLVALGREMPRQAGQLMLFTLVGMFVTQTLSLLFAGQSAAIGQLALVELPFLVVGGLYLLVGRQQAQTTSA